MKRMKRVVGWHDVAHLIKDAHRSVSDMIRILPETEQYQELAEAGRAFKVMAEHRLIVTPEQILNQKEEQK